MNVPKPKSVINQAAHAIIHCLQQIPSGRATRHTVKLYVYSLGYNKWHFNHGFDRIARAHWLLRISAKETGMYCVFQLTDLGRRAGVWHPEQSE